jgi:hypothetical protein
VAVRRRTRSDCVVRSRATPFVDRAAVIFYSARCAAAACSGVIEWQ